MNIKNIKFKCDLQKCHSRCCLGSTGAHLGKGEADIIRSLMPLLGLPEENMEVCKHWTDNRHTPIINNGCAFLLGTGIDRHCAIQYAYNIGLTDFVKPISCHLFPLRASSDGKLTFEFRECCKVAFVNGVASGTTLEDFFKDALIRRGLQDE